MSIQSPFPNKLSQQKTLTERVLFLYILYTVLQSPDMLFGFLFSVSVCVKGAPRSPRFARLARCPDMLFGSLCSVSVCKGGDLARFASLCLPGARTCCSALFALSLYV